MNKNKILSIVKIIFAGFTVALFVYFYGRITGVWQGYPKGTDAPMHMGRMKYWLEFFPNIFWNYQWANGMPFLGTYAPLFHILGSLLVKVGLSYEQVLFSLYFFSLCLLGFSVWGLVRQISKNYWLAMLAGLLSLSAFRVWDTVVQGGAYSRFFAISLWLFTGWMIVKLINKIHCNKQGKKDYIVVVAALSSVMLSHVLIATFCWLMVIFIIFTSRFKLNKKITLFFNLILASFTVNAWFYLPLFIRFFFGGGGARFFGDDFNLKPVPFIRLFDLVGNGPLIIPLLIFSLILLFLVKNIKDHKKMVLPFLLTFLVFFFYTFGFRLGLPLKYYLINGFIPYSGLSLMAVFASVLIGSNLGLVINKLKRFVSIISLFVFIILSTLAFYFVVKIPKALTERDNVLLVYDVTREGRPEERSQKIIKFQDQDLMSRFMSYDAFESVWFNYLYNVPQAKDYYAQGVLHPDWRFWLEQALWNNDEYSLKEAKFGLDWFALRFFMATESPWLTYAERKPVSESQLRYLKDKDFKLVTYTDSSGLGGGSAELRLFQLEALESPKILSASNAPKALFVGNLFDYQTFIRSLSFSNINSQQLIPFYGGENINIVNNLDLEQFNLLIFYQTKIKPDQILNNSLKSFVEKGGLLYIEGLSNDSNFTETIPVKNIDTILIQGDWNFQKQKNPLVSNIDFQVFDKADYEGDAWKTQTALKLTDWAKPLALIDNKAVLVAGSLGEGQVIWSGMNFLFHLVSHKNNQEELKLWENIIDSVLEKTEAESTDFQSQFINPQKRKITINNQAKTIVFRESYYPNWKSYLKSAEGKQTLDVFQAGPGVMAVNLPNQYSLPAQIEFVYRLAWFEVLGIALSVLGIIVFIIYIFEGFILKSGVREKLSPFSNLKNIGTTIGGWWDKDEE